MTSQGAIDRRFAMAVCFGALLALPAHAEQQLRIGVGRFQTPVVIEGSTLVAETPTGTSLATGKTVRIEAKARGLAVNGKELVDRQIHVTAGGPMTLRAHKYEGLLEVQWHQKDGKPELLVVHPIGLERYVAGIVASELPQRWPMEALKAQAVAARTYAIWQKHRRLALPYHMESSVLDQVYGGVGRLHPDAITATEATHGLVLTWQRRPIQAYFHATAGGFTESGREGWGTDLPYLKARRCDYGQDAPRDRWTARISSDELARAFGSQVGTPIRSVEIEKRSESGRARTLLIKGPRGTKRVTGEELRRTLGYTKVWSTRLTAVSMQRDALVLEGRGAGHGVGMSQWGARGRAQAGQEYPEILSAYYPGARLVPLYAPVRRSAEHSM